MISKVDLRGLVCPEPVLRTRKLLDDAQVERIEALVDDDVCVNNLERLSRSVKAQLSVKPADGYFEVVIERRPADPHSHAQAAEPEAQTQRQGQPGQAKVGTVIFLAKDTFGEGDAEFSRSLINIFLQTVKSSGHEVRAVLMANTGVKLMARDSQVLPVLDEFRAAGCEVLACGLCLEYYGLKDQVPKEQITNMFAICEYLFAADKVLSP